VTTNSFRGALSSDLALLRRFLPYCGKTLFERKFHLREFFPSACPARLDQRRDRSRSARLAQGHSHFQKKKVLKKERSFGMEKEKAEACQPRPLPFTMRRGRCERWSLCLPSTSRCAHRGLWGSRASPCCSHDAHQGCGSSCR